MRCTLIMLIGIWLTVITPGRRASPWRSMDASEESSEIPPVTTVIWPGLLKTAGAFLMSRINLNFFNDSCTKLSSDMEVAAQVATVLANTELVGTTNNQISHYAFLMLKIETEFHQVLLYQKDLLLCSGRGSELWSNFRKFRTQASLVWSLLKNTDLGISKYIIEGIDRADNNNTLINSTHVKNQDITLDTYVSNNTDFSTGSVLISLLEKNRPPLLGRQPRHPGLIGLGIGLLGGFFLTKFFNSQNNHDIIKLNHDIEKQNQMIRLTNERIDILTKNVTNSFKTVTKLLEKLTQQQEWTDIHLAILWNLEQIILSTANVRNEFRSGEVTVTLLEKNILNPELLNLVSLNKTITEGLKSFPELEFPVEISRYNMYHIIKLLHIQRISHLKFLIIIPLTHKNPYSVYTLIPHPVKIDETSLVVPEMKEVLLKNKGSYIIAEASNIYSPLRNSHVLLTVEPVYNDNKLTCEYAGFLQNTSAVLKLCNYKKAGQVADTFVVETDSRRLVYFSKLTRVTFDCPDKVMKDTLIGLHKLPLECHIFTDQVHWPAKLTSTVESIDSNDLFTIDSTKLPIASVNKSSQVHKSLRDLINKLKSNNSYTIDFDHYGVTVEQVATISAIIQAVVTPLVIINSIILAFLVIKWVVHKRMEILSRTSSINLKIRKLRDSLRSQDSNDLSRSSSFSNKFRRARDSIRSRRNKLKDSFQHRKEIVRRSMRDKIRNSTLIKSPVTKLQSTLDVGTNTEGESHNNDSHLDQTYPAIPRYN